MNSKKISEEAVNREKMQYMKNIGLKDESNQNI